MSSIVISGDTSGAVTLAAPAIAGTNTLTLQAATATNAVNKLETALAYNWNGLTTNTSLDFTSLPSWIKKITVMFNGVSLSSTAQILVQLGDSGGIESTSYVSSSAQARDALASIGGTSTAGFLIYQGSGGGNNATGIMTICLISGTTWISSHSASNTAASSGISGGGTKTLSDTLTQIRITSTSTDTFDAGSVNLLLEG